MIKQLNKIKVFINRAYRLSLDYQKQENLVWEDLKKLHTEAEWRSGIYETDKSIETVFAIANETPSVYHFRLYEQELQCSVNVLEGFESELATDVFLLASHFNNLLKVGVVQVDVNSATVAYRVKRDILVPLLYGGETYELMNRHYDTSKDIYWAFQKLVVDSEEPALIIADLLKSREEKGAQAEEP